jgi:ATP-dependent Clp protease ATP-binding subunit ClpC
VGRSLTPRLGAILALARREAELLEQEPAAEHVLLALAWEGRSSGARVLKDLGISDPIDHDLRQRLRERDRLREPLLPGRVLQLASKEAEALGHDFLGSEHVLLAMTQLETGLISEIFDELGARSRIRTALLQRLKTS